MKNNKLADMLQPYREGGAFPSYDQLAAIAGQDQGSAAVRGEAVAEFWKPTIIQLANACKKYEEAADFGVPEHGMAQAFQYLLSNIPVAASLSARAADAPSEPSESGSRLFAWLVRASQCGIKPIEQAAEVLKDYYQGVGPEPEYDQFRAADAPSEPRLNLNAFSSYEAYEIYRNELRCKSRAADALDSQPTDSSMPVDMSQAKRWIVQLRGRVDTLLAIINEKVPASSQPTDGGVQS